MAAGVAWALWAWWWPWLGIALLAGAGVLARLSGQPRRIAGFFVFGAVWCGWQVADARAARVERARPAVIAGCVASAVRVDGDRLRFDLTGVRLAPGHRPRRVRVAWYSPSRVPAAGECWRFAVRLRPPRALVNAHGADTERAWFVRRVAGLATVRSGSAVRLAEPGARAPLLRLRLALAARVRFAAGEAGFAPLYVALTVGLRDALTGAQWHTLNATGTSHLIAISGLHVGLVAGAALLLGRAACGLGPWRARAREAGLAAALVAALAYAALAGFSLPTQRALVMVAVFATAALRRVRLGAGDGLAVACVLVLLLEPVSLLSVGFWLSFGAVATLATLAGRRGLWSAQWRVFVGLLPILALLTGRASWISPWVNAVSVPLFSLAVVPAALCAAVVAAVAPAAAPSLYAALDRSLDVWWGALDGAARAPGAATTLHAPPVWAAAMALAGGAGLLALAATWRGRALAGLACLPLLLGRPAAPPEGTFAIEVFDTGQALAVAIRTRRHTIVYDTGGRWRMSDAGARIVVPQLVAQGVTGVWAMVISHADLDHRGGARSVLAALPVARVFAGEPLPGIAARPCESGRRWTLDGVHFAFLHPSARPRPTGNDASCVLRVEGDYGRALVTGDAEALTELALLHEGADVRADAVIGQHHGSRTSSSADFVAATGARWVVFATGYDNRWSLPAGSVVARWRAAGAQVLTTARSGAITLRFGPDGATVTRSRVRRSAAWRFEAPP